MKELQSINIKVKKNNNLDFQIVFLSVNIDVAGQETSFSHIKKGIIEFICGFLF